MAKPTLHRQEISASPMVGRRNMTRKPSSVGEMRFISDKDTAIHSKFVVTNVNCEC